MSKDELKYKVLSRLLNGETPKAISDTSDAGYATVLRWNRQLEEARLNDSIAELMNLDKSVLDSVLTVVKDQSPSEVQEAVGEVLTDVQNSRTILEALQHDFVDTANYLNKRIKALSLSVENIGELSMLADTLCSLQNAFFNKNSTQVNVQNNYESAPAYANLLEDKPAELPPNH